MQQFRKAPNFLMPTFEGYPASKAPGKKPAYLNIVSTFDLYVWLLLGAAIVAIALLLLFMARVWDNEILRSAFRKL